MLHGVAGVFFTFVLVWEIEQNSSLIPTTILSVHRTESYSKHSELLLQVFSELHEIWYMALETSHDEKLFD